MKKFEKLGRSLSKEEQKKIIGGYVPPDGCATTYTGCNNSPEYGGLTCDYHVHCTSGSSWDVCFTQCNHGDGSGCAV